MKAKWTSGIKRIRDDPPYTLIRVLTRSITLLICINYCMLFDFALSPQCHEELFDKLILLYACSNIIAKGSF